jgi:hypothetical protein
MAHRNKVIVVVNRGQRTRGSWIKPYLVTGLLSFLGAAACADFAQLDVQSAAADRDVLHTALSPHRDLDCRTRTQACQSAINIIRKDRRASSPRIAGECPRLDM